MDDAPSEHGELKEMRKNIRRTVNSLEVCWSCQRICECKQWLVNKGFPIWLCIECPPEVLYRLEKQSGVPVTILHT
jgi:hypothetical protein